MWVAISLPWFPRSVVFCIIVMAGDAQHSPKRYLRARHDIDSQKFPVIVYARTANGAAKSDPAMHTLEYVFGLL